MRKLCPDVVARYPVVAVYVAQDSPRFKRGVYTLRLIRSDGVYMLCCDEDGEPSLIRISEVSSVIARPTDEWAARYDKLTGHIVYRKPNASETFSTGPVKGRADPSINLRTVAKGLDLDYDALLAGDATEEMAPNTPSVSGMTTEQISQGPAERSVEELLRLDGEDDDDAMLTEEELAVPSLDDIDLDEDDDFEMEDVELDKEHKGRISDD